MRLLVLTAALLASLGCGGAPDDLPELATVYGKVLQDGEPKGGLTVEFFPTGGTTGPKSTGLTNDDGTFSLGTGTHNGAVVGSHKVLVKCPWRLTGRKAAPTADGFGSSADGKSPTEGSGGDSFECTLDPKFEDSNTTPLTAQVPSGGVSDLVFEVTSGK